jgi:hypothetical protein
MWIRMKGVQVAAVHAWNNPMRTVYVTQVYTQVDIERVRTE